MKRLLVSICCIALFAGTVPLLSRADESEGTTTTTTTDSSLSSSSTTQSTTSTTAPSDFTFTEYNRTYDETTGVLSVVWNYAEAGGADVIAVNLDGKQYIASGSQGRFTVNLGQVAGGSHALQYVLRLSDGSTKIKDVDPLERDSTSALILTVSVHPGAVAAHLTDETGTGVADYPLQFTLNQSTVVNRTTGQDGRVEFAVTGTLTSVSCVAPGRTVGVIQYIGTSASWQDNSITTTAPSDDDDDDDDDDFTTTSRTRWSATTTSRTTGTVQTFATITGAGTTKADGDKVAVNVTFDEGVVKAFGLSNDDFNERARLLVDKTLYSTLVGNSKATVMMSAGYNPFEITDQHISSLVSGKSKYSKYTDVKRVAVTLGLQFVDENKTAVPIAVAPAGSYTVRLPVPASMTDCPVLAVAVLGENGLSDLIDVQVKNGYLEFVTNGFTSIAVLGFGDHALKTGGGVAWQLIVLLAVGVLLLAGAGLLMYFFVWRKPKKDEETEDEAAGDDTLPQPDIAPTQPPANTEDTFMIDRPQASQPNHTVELGRDVLGEEPANEEDSHDLYSSDSRRPPRDND